ncbi:MAG: ribonuclease HI family protein [Pseudomonadota bacterium]
MHSALDVSPINAPIPCDILSAIVYKGELAASQRLARDLALSPEDALRRVLLKIAKSDSLHDLVTQRQAVLRQIATSEARRQQNRTQKQGELQARRQLKLRPDPSAWYAWFDGATNPNPGKMGLGAVLESPDGMRVEISRAAGHGDSNEAEYLALIALLDAAVLAKPHKLFVFGDSQVVIDDVNRLQPAGVQCLRPYRERATTLMSALPSATLCWVPRHKNSAADALSQRALEMLA